MRKTLLLIPYLLMGILFFNIFNNYYEFSLEHDEPHLHTPQGNIAFSVTPFNMGGYYFRDINSDIQIFPEFNNWFYALSPNVAAIIIFQMSVFFLFLFGRIRKLEFYYIIFAFLLSAQYALYLDYVSIYQFVPLFYWLTFLLNVAFIFVLHALFNKKTVFRNFLPGAIICAILVSLLYPENKLQERRIIFIIGLAHLGTFLYGLRLLWVDIRRPFRSPIIKDHRVRWVLAFTSLIIIAVPGTSYLAAVLWKIPVSMNKNAIFFLPSIFPMLMLLFSLRYGFISFAVPIQSFFIRLAYYLYFAFLYWFLVGFQLDRFTDYKEHIWLHVFYAFVIIFTFDFLRTFSYVTLNQYLLYRRFAFNEYLTELSKYINNPIQLSDLITRIRDIVILGTGASNAMLYVSDEVFEGWNVDKRYIQYLPSEHYIWKQMRRKNRPSSYPYATLTNGGSVQDLLQKQGGFLFIIFHQFPLGIMLFDKSNKEPYFSEDISFIRNLIRSTEPLLENYSLLINNIKQKRIEKELEAVSGLQKKIFPIGLSTKHVQIAPFVQPYMMVTGDYVDVIQKSENEFYLFLGDVSGHGLASAYLMVAVRSMIHGGMQVKTPNLEEIITNINDMLIANQSASSIMTLCAIRIRIITNQRKKKIQVSYINAGQHAPMVYLEKSKKFYPLDQNQRVLGAISDQYLISEQEFKESLRIILTSDGAFEIFNTSGDILGEKKFMNWIEDSILMEPEKQIVYLVDKIRDYTMTKEKTDDISMLVADISV